MNMRADRRAVPGDTNVVKTETEKILSYIDRTVEIQRGGLTVQVKVLAVIVGAAGTISKSLRQYPSNRSVKHVIKELQKTAIHIGHCTLTAESADVEVV
jgi:hypothetical protein